jgi:hypothetical protein
MAAIVPAQSGCVRLVHALLLLSFAMLGAGCADGDRYRVHARISIADDARAPVSDLSVIVGGERFFRHRMRPGSTERVTLRTDPRAERGLTLLYTQDGERHAWDGPVPADNRGYRIRLTIEAAGQLSAALCALPCRWADVRPMAY